MFAQLCLSGEAKVLLWYYNGEMLNMEREFIATVSSQALTCHHACPVW